MQTRHIISPLNIASLIVIGILVFGATVGNSMYYSREEQKENRKPWDKAMNTPAPDFILKDLDGRTKTLRSFRGKYLLLDFCDSYGSWEKYQLPDLEKCYEKYREKVEFATINYYCTEKEWRKYAEEKKLEWVNLFDENSTIEESYKNYLSAYPDWVLLNKRGKLVGVYSIIEEEELYEKLDELLQ